MNYRGSKLDVKSHTNESLGKSILNPSWLGKKLYIILKIFVYSFSRGTYCIITTIIVISAFINTLVLVRSTKINSLKQMFSRYQNNSTETFEAKGNIHFIELFYGRCCSFKRRLQIALSQLAVLDTDDSMTSMFRLLFLVPKLLIIFVTHLSQQINI